MPATPAYFHRLSEAIAVFRESPLDWIDRRHLQETLGVSKTVAWRILRRCGAAEGPGNTLVCQRDDLVGALEQILVSGACEREVRRRDRLEKAVEQLARLAHSRGAQVAQTDEARELRDSRFQKLPEGIELTPRRLTIAFQGTQDFLQKFGAVVFALQNDYDTIAKYLDRST